MGDILYVSTRRNTGLSQDTTSGSKIEGSASFVTTTSPVCS